MAKLYPPTIPGALPATAITNNAKIIRVPFTLNKSVGINDIGSIKIKVKSITENKILFCANISSMSYVTFSADGKTGTAVFHLNSMGLTSDEKKEFYEGQFYKVQIACVSTEQFNNGASDQELYWSNVGIVKAIGNVTVNVRCSLLKLYLEYEQTDPTEKLYSINYKIQTKKNNQLIKTYNKEIIINNNIQVYSGGNTEVEIVNLIDLDYGIGYANLTSETFVKAEYEVEITTINGYQQKISSSKDFKITIQNTGPSNSYYGVNFVFTPNSENVLMDIRISPYHSDTSKNRGGKIYKTVFNPITQMAKNSFVYEYPGNRSRSIIIQDRNLEFGQFVKYFIPLQNDEELNIWNCYDTFSSNGVQFDFDGMFLSDKDRQLHIKFDPKLSSLKPVIQEQKVETMGSKYPFFTRNGIINYFEFPINGLISYNMDLEEQFMILDKQHRERLGDSTTDLTTNNIIREKIFRNEVLKWLSNGEPKLLRTSTEGNFLVRLTGVSFTPNDQLGRMIYSFSATATEIADCDNENLKKYNLI